MRGAEESRATHKARLRQAMAATKRCLPKKHMPMLFHSCAEFGVCTAATRYLTSATSMSLWSWMMEPAARIVFGLPAEGSRRSGGHLRLSKRGRGKQGELPPRGGQGMESSGRTRVVGERVAQEVKGLVVLAEAQVEQAHRRQQLER